MSFRGTSFVGHAKTDDGLDRDDRRTGIRLCGLHRLIDGGNVIPIRYDLGMPAISVEPCHPILGKGNFRIPFNRDVVIIVQVDHFAKF